MRKAGFLLVLALLALGVMGAYAQTKSVSIACWDTWYSPVGYNSNPPVWQEVQKRTGIKITFNVFDDYDTKIQTVIASGANLPDIFIVPPTWSGPIGVYRLALEKVIIPLDDLIASPDAVHIRQLLAQRTDYKKLLTAPDGHIYTIPDLPLTGIAQQFLIRDDWLKKLGLARPETADQWYAVLKAFKDRDPNGNGQADEVPWSFTAGNVGNIFMTAFGMTPQDYVADANGVVTAQFVSDAYKSYLTYLNKLYSENLMDREQRDESGLQALEAQNRVGMIAEWTDIYLRFENMVKSGGVANASVVALPPAHLAGQKQGYYVDRSPFWNHYAISASSKNAQAAIKLMDYLWADPDGLRLKEFGIQGKSFTMVSGQPAYTDFVLSNPDKLAPMDAVRSLGGSPSIFVHDLKEAYIAKAVDNPKLVQFFNDLPKYLVQPFPEVIPLEQESKDLTRILADLNTYRTEMMGKFINGQEPLSNYSQYVTTLKGMGLDQVVKIKQAQYDRYSGKK